MAGGSSDSVLLKHLHGLYHVGAAGGLTDGQLLERFVSGRDGGAEAAFTALAQRHGPMVLRVCRQMLGDPHDAHDAFQATFLVLVRKAGAVRKLDSVASWLHGVAQRVAMRIRADAVRRRIHERRGAATAAADSPGETAQAESWPELHEEVARLPARYREPVVLCYFEGLTTEAAAQKLGCPQGTVLSRLSRGRARLRERLTRRGLALPAGLLAAGLCPEAATAAVPAAVLDAMVRVSLGFAQQQPTPTALASTNAVALAKGILHAMTLSKLKIIGGAALAGALALGGMQTFAQFGGTSETRKAARPAPEAGDPQAALSRSVQQLQAGLDEANKRNAELQKELQDLRAKLGRPGAGQPAAVAKGAAAESGKGEMPTIPNIPRIEGLGGPGNLLGGGGGEPMYVSYGRYIFVTSPIGDKFAIYDIQTNRAKSLALPASKDAPLTVLPSVGEGFISLTLFGPKITRLFVFSINDWTWYPIDLREPATGSASLQQGHSVAAYGQGCYIYAFSGETRRWSVLELPKGARAQRHVLRDSVIITHNLKIDEFSGKTGEWKHTDVRAVVDAAIDVAESPETKQAKPEQ